MRAAELSRRRQSGLAPMLAALAMLAMLCSTAGAAGAVIAEQTLRYAATYAGVNAGEIQIDIRHEDDGYVVTSTAKPSRLARLFFKAHTSVTRFVRRAGALALHSGEERLLGDNGYQRSFRFNRAADRIEFSNGKRRDIQPGDQFEAAAFPLLLMLRPLAGIAETLVREVSARRVRDYRYAAPVAEAIAAPAGELACWKIIRRRADRPTDTVTVWLRQAAGEVTDGMIINPLPLKIVITKNGKTSALALLGA